MSLLLDALKKAAEQKAENSGETIAERESSDETVVLDQTDTSITSESESIGQRELADETHLKEHTTQITPEGKPATQWSSGEETQVLDQTATITPEIDSPDHQESDNKTELLDQTTRIASENETFSQDAGIDGTLFDLSETNLENDENDEPVVIDTESMPGGFNEDEATVFTDDDVTAFMGENTLLRYEADTAYQQQQDAESRSPTQPGDADDLDDNDQSISLFEEDDTQLAQESAERTDVGSEEIELELELVPQIDPTKSLNLVDVPDEDGTQNVVGRPQTADELVPASETQTLTIGETSTRRDSTSTATFAPDNYDRTLRKPESAGVTSLFAGVRSDTDVVMTPEYAKKMFLSKSSAQRVQGFKIYGGTFFVIVVIAVIFGVLELEKDTENIDNKLRHLKRDPMPGMIKNATGESFTDVFAALPGSEVDASTLKLVENAELILDTEKVVAVELGVEKEIPIENSNLDQDETKIETGAEVQANPVVKAETAPVDNVRDNNITVVNISNDEPVASNSIQISSKSRITNKDRWLREAYAAYLRGDDKTALEKYNAVLDIDPISRNALLARAAINIHNNRIAEAIRDYQALLIVNPKDSLAMSSMIAVARYSPEQTETQIKLMIRDEPDSPYLNFALGNIFGAQNRWQEAQGRYFTALENNPDDPNYAYNLAVSLEHIEKPSVAITYYELAINNFNKGLATFNRDVVDARLEMLKQL